MKIAIVMSMMLISLSSFTQTNSIQEMTAEKVKIEIWSDVVCPFCFIGKKKLERAITKMNAENEVEIIWRSFQLYPDFPKNESLPIIQYLTEKKGYSIDQIKGISNKFSAQGKNYGIDFHFDKSIAFNTLVVHRLVHWAQTLERSNELKEELMIAYFTEGIDLSKETNLYPIIEKVGLDLDDARSIIQSDAYSKDVFDDIRRSRTVGVRGVPFFFINEKEVISGAQNDQIFENIIASALKNVKPVQEIKEGSVCLPDKECK